MFRYFGDGLAHFLVGIVFVAVFSLFCREEKKRDSLFWVGFILASSALFFLPNKIPLLGRSGNWLYQFFHYPVSDWDILFLGFSWHRFFFTHSFLLALIAIGGIGHNSKHSGFSQGLGIGLSGHLIWDGVSCSWVTPVVFVPGFIALSGWWAKAWLVGNGVVAFLLARRARA